MSESGIFPQDSLDNLNAQKEGDQTCLHKTVTCQQYFQNQTQEFNKEYTCAIIVCFHCSNSL